MAYTRRSLLAATGTTLALAGCLGDGGDAGDATDTDTPTATDTATPTDTATETQSMGPTVQVATHPDLGDILVGPDGRTLYMFDSDTQGSGSSTCSDGCASAWPPLTVDGMASAGDGVTAELTTFEREDGATQVAAAGWPLYYFASDSSPGDANGQGANDVWWVLRPDGTVVRGSDTDTATPTEGGGEETTTDPYY
ncbi:COG4315 family predicted lipoprotein [Haloarchaeobius sp. DYHT-AS-18]|uniref:COG4315 family predicted lipoprotein n=1 Tax=Haloarchaeobius sp. DYHT-AS-18 TaxID=3446117 RepID=UPI003EBB7470